MKPTTRPMRVLLISDGRPGHYRQSEGVVAALERRRIVTVTRLELGTRFPLPKGLIPKIARWLPPAQFVRAIHGLDPAALARPDVAKPDIIVSSGGATLGANVALARIWGVPNVFSGSTRGFPLSAFHLVLTPFASVASAPNVVAGPKPTPFDPDAIPPPRALESDGSLKGARISVLVGGPTPHADFDGEDWSRLAALIGALASQHACKVTIATSPRTPAAAYDTLVPLADKFRDAVTLIDFRAAGPGSIGAAFDCDLILITSDSMSMMTEAALSRRAAAALAPRTTTPSRDDEAVAGLVAKKTLAVLPLATTDVAALTKAVLALDPMTTNHLDDLAAVLVAAIDVTKTG